ncbi:MAG: hypothetical protein ACOYN0_16700, partial [Phycisphaerales bacterium]
MSTQEIIQRLIAELGQSQRDRTPPQLDPAYFLPDERTPADLIREITAYASLIGDVDGAGSGTWEAVLGPALADPERLLALSDGSAPAHAALIAAFAEIHAHTSATVNTFTARHLKHQVEHVLGFGPRAAAPDHVHVLAELKRGAAPTRIGPEHFFPAGKAQGRERAYGPVRDTIVNQSTISAVKAVRREAESLRFAPVAASADGLGGPLAGGLWNPFGPASSPGATVGFAFASPVLAMAEGTRRLEIDLNLSGGTQPSGVPPQLSAYFTGPKGWLGPFPVTSQRTAGKLTLAASLDAAQPAVVGYDPKLHAHSFACVAPVVQFLCPRGEFPSILETASLGKARARVTVSGVTTFTAENDLGQVNTKKQFLPFGTQPSRGSKFTVRAAELGEKQVTSLRLRVRWKDVPQDLVSWYDNYPRASTLSSGLTGTLSLRDAGGPEQSRGLEVLAKNPGVESEWSLEPSSGGSPRGIGGSKFQYLLAHGDLFAKSLGSRIRLANPIQASPVASRAQNQEPPGTIVVELNKDLLHADYPDALRNAVAEAARQSTYTAEEINVVQPAPVREPFTPVALSLT